MTLDLTPHIHRLSRYDQDDPWYEVEAPEGYHWTAPVEGHFFVAWTQNEIRDILRTATLQPCPPDCDCRMEE